MSEDRRRRIGLVVGQLSYGGAEGQLYELARGLRKSCDVFVYCLSDQSEPYGTRIAELEIPLRLLPASRNLDPGRVVRLASQLGRDRVEVVHAFLFIASAYAYLATRLVKGSRLVTSARNCKLEPHRLKRAIMRRAFRASDAVICNSAEMAEFAGHHYGVPEGRSVVVYNGVDLERFADTGRARGNGESLRIGTVGRIESQKNLDLFIDVAAEVSRDIPGASFEIVGEGSQKDRLMEKVSAMGLEERVRFVGASHDVAAFLAGLDQFWLTSDWEGTPNVVLEAMASGLPVVATRVGGTAELIEDGVNGFLVEAGDRRAICRASLSLYGQEGLAARIGRQARLTAEQRFSLPQMVTSTVAVYERIGRGRVR